MTPFTYGLCYAKIKRCGSGAHLGVRIGDGGERFGHVKPQLGQVGNLHHRGLREPGHSGEGSRRRQTQIAQGWPKLRVLAQRFD